MRKIILPFIVIVVAALLLSTTACKQPDFEMSWFSLEGSGFYETQDDSSSIKISGVVEFEIPRVATEPMWAQIVAWEYIIREGNQVVLDIHDENYYTVLGDLIISKSAQQSDFLWVVIETNTPKVGDIYSGANPDSVELIMWIVDSNGNSYVMDNTVAFDFLRN